MFNIKNRENSFGNKVLKIILTILLFLSNLLIFSALWFKTVYGFIGFDSILFTLGSKLSGVQSDLVKSYIFKALCPALLITCIFSFLLLFYRGHKLLLNIKTKNPKNLVILPFKKSISTILSILISLALILSSFKMVKLDEYIINCCKTSNIFEDYYIDPDSVTIQFPEEKRNLIYIFLESMETSYTSKELGGAEKYNLIPELYNLAENNINFSQTDGLGGWQSYTGATWTVGSMVSQSSGIPLSAPIDGNSYGKFAKFLPGVTTLMDILHDNGYNQAVMMGSDSTFGGRDKYYSQHGVDNIYDVYTARKDGIIPEDYWVWWGMEDLHLFEYAKQKISDMASQSKPFSFSMLTVDTHFEGGYKCELCRDDYPEQYENVIACSSRQVGAFIDWIKEQDFYDNTTIVICGDHNTMDNQYVERNFDSDYLRHVYNCYINSAVQTTNSKNREITPFDMFPTTLAAMGCKIEGDKLGIGTNLFSDNKTIAEQLGADGLNDELNKKSDYYIKEFL